MIKSQFFKTFSIPNRATIFQCFHVSRTIISHNHQYRIRRAFLANIIKAIQRSKTPDNDDNLLKVKVCIYIDALITYFKQVNQVRSNAIVKLQPISKVTSKLDMHIKKKFSQPNVNKL